MTDKELRAYVEKLMRDALEGGPKKVFFPNGDVLHFRDIPKELIDAVYRHIVDFRAKAQAERYICYLSRHLAGSSAANPLDQD